MTKPIKEVKLSDGKGTVIVLSQYETCTTEEVYIYGVCENAGSMEKDDFNTRLIVLTKNLGMHVVL